MAITTTTSDIGFFLRVRGLFSGIQPRPKALAHGEAAMPIRRDADNPWPVLLSGNMLKLNWGLKTSRRVVIGTENTTVVRYEDEWIALAAFRAFRVGRK